MNRPDVVGYVTLVKFTLSINCQKNYISASINLRYPSLEPHLRCQTRYDPHYTLWIGLAAEYPQESLIPRLIPSEETVGLNVNRT